MPSPTDKAVFDNEHVLDFAQDMMEMGRTTTQPVTDMMYSHAAGDLIMKLFAAQEVKKTTDKVAVWLKDQRATLTLDGTSNRACIPQPALVLKLCGKVRTNDATKDSKYGRVAKEDPLVRCLQRDHCERRPLRQLASFRCQTWHRGHP